MSVYVLEPQYDGRKSFYRKAMVDIDFAEGMSKLYSYGTYVAYIRKLADSGSYEACVYGTYSVTTLRHIKEFLRQHGFKADTAKQIMQDYGIDKWNN